MGIPLNHPAIIQAIERGLIRATDLNPAPVVTPTTPTKPTPKRKAPSVSTTTAARWSITLTLACRVVSEANRRDHWSVQRRRSEMQAAALHKALEGAGLSHHTPPLPLSVTWARIGRQTLDDDNLSRAFKSLRDRLADWIGIDDGDDRIDWHYQQRAGEPGVELTIGSRTPCKQP
ncbi:MAG: hypothetical protein C0467_07040 [Planctomycetaceae bacterium]|nr:hypothetical protein [Planctomycetaceae bacterium]